MPADLEGLVASAIQFAGAAGEVILPLFRQPLEIENKERDGFDPVTVADKGAEVRIREAIADRYPSHGVFGEEFGHQGGDGLTWVIDPIDGTRAFMTGMVHWGVLLALFDGETPILGVMHQPFTNEYFVGTNVDAWYLRGEEKRALRVRSCPSLSVASMASTGPQYFASEPEQAAFHSVRKQVRLTRYGGDCYLYCLLAMGQLDLAIEAGLKPYDIQALIPIIRGAGGVVTTWDAGDPAMGGRIIAAGDTRIHAAAIALLEAGLR